MGLLGTLTAGVTGVYITQRLVDKREIRTWQREKERDRERWAREDQALTFEHRRETYTEFYQAVEELLDEATDNAFNLQPKRDLSGDWYLPTYMKLQRLTIYASPEVGVAANKVFEAVQTMGYWSGRYDNDQASKQRFDVAHDAFEPRQFELLKLIRRDLLVPGAPLEVAPWSADSPHVAGPANADKAIKSTVTQAGLLQDDQGPSVSG
jgi:hypothetical protein